MSTFANSEDRDEMQQNADFIRVYTVCKCKRDLQTNKIQFFFLKIITCNPRYVQRTIPSLLYQTRRNNP